MTPVVPTQPIPKKSQQIKTDKPRPHICLVCTRAFARLEHLKRHERSHTNEKPFQCAACGRCFARRDLVLRHQQKLHADLPNLGRRPLEVSTATLSPQTAQPQGPPTPATGSEHIIVLTNNTNANAPLPGDDSPFLPHKQLPLPMPTLLLQNTPPWTGSGMLPRLPPKKELKLPQGLAKLTPNAILGRHMDRLQGHGRHASFSAALGSGYAQPHDPPAEDKTLLLLGLEMDLGTFDWHQDPPQLFKNLLQYFVENTTNFANPSHPHHLPGSTPEVFPLPRPRQLLITLGQLEHAHQLGQSHLMDHQLGQAHLADHQLGQAHLDHLLDHPLEPPAKKPRMDFQFDDDDDDWLHELILVPTEPVPEFSEAMEPTLLGSLPLLLLFRTRQHDLRATATPATPHPFITVELRNRILLLLLRLDLLFPTVDELNHYMGMYELEFNKYFPFIHLPLLKNPRVNNVENIPLLLLMCLIGALYSFAEQHTQLLFNLSKFHIQRFFESEIIGEQELRFNKVPLMAHQCLVLHIFILMFLNEANVVDITLRQVKLMIGLIRLTHFNEPLEKFLVPPSPLAVTPAQYVQNKFDYFIMAQLRIRTLHVFYMLQTLRSAIIGQPVFLTSQMMALGCHCVPEDLWKCQTGAQLAHECDAHGLTHVPIVDLANGRGMDQLVASLRLPSQPQPPLLANNHLLLLTYINEQLQAEMDACALTTRGFNYFLWKLTHKPHLMLLMRTWEQRYQLLGLPLAIDAHNRHLLNIHNELRLLLPIHSYLHIRLEVNVCEVMQACLGKQWDEMNAKIDALVAQEGTQENCKHAMPYALNILNLWLHNIELINYDIKQTALRTPVFFVVCILVAMLVVLTYLQHLEQLPRLLDNDLLNWFEMELVLLKVDKILTPLLKLLYLEHLLNNKGFASIARDHRVRNILNLINKKEVAPLDADADQLSTEISQEVKLVQLLVKLLYLGIRILADAPVWPVALGFSEAMKKRANKLKGPNN